VTALPSTGGVLVVGPSNAGKTRHTAAALDRWLADNGPEGVVVFDFAPEVKRDDGVLGGRLEQFTTVPGEVWHAVLDAHAPRAESDDDTAALTLARDNAERARALFAAAPTAPTAVFVNDATIPFQADGDTTPLVEYCAGATLVVANAFESAALGTDDPVSRNEREALDRLRTWSETTIELA
jgi:hypothetical protein